MTEVAPSANAVLLVGFGGPDRPEDVRPFIEDVVRGKNVPPERIDLVVDQYRQIGGRSPYNELTARQAEKLQATISGGASVFTGMLHSQPLIKQALQAMVSAQVLRAAGIILAPQRSEASYQKYLNAVNDALSAIPVERRPKIEFVEGWHTHPLFIQAISDRVRQLLAQIPAADLEQTRLIFTAHSIPQEMSDRSGYARQVEETSAAVVAELGTGVPWTVGYQSRSGPPNQKWLEPDVCQRLSQARQEGKTTAIVVPVGFLVDHVEVLFDLDVLAASAARDLGMNMLRAQTVCDHEKFVSLLAGLAREKIESFYAKPERL
jgi:ferrochelatase